METTISVYFIQNNSTSFNPLLSNSHNYKVPTLIDQDLNQSFQSSDYPDDSLDELYEGGGKVNNLEKADSDVDNIDFENFKGIYFDEDPNRKYQDPETGCHFEYFDLCKRLAKLK
jgi:hypothetical protein